MVWRVSLGKGFWMVNTWRAPVRKWLKTWNCVFLHDSAFFLTMSHSFLIAIIQWGLKGYFIWKQLKADYLKNILKANIAGTVFFVPWLATYKCKQISENCNSVGAGVQKLGKIVSLWLNFDPYFSGFWSTWKR